MSFNPIAEVIACQSFKFGLGGGVSGSGCNNEGSNAFKDRVGKIVDDVILDKRPPVSTPKTLLEPICKLLGLYLIFERFLDAELMNRNNNTRQVLENFNLIPGYINTFLEAGCVDGGMTRLAVWDFFLEIKMRVNRALDFHRLIRVHVEPEILVVMLRGQGLLDLANHVSHMGKLRNRLLGLLLSVYNNTGFRINGSLQVPEGDGFSKYQDFFEGCDPNGFSQPGHEDNTSPIGIFNQMENLNKQWNSKGKPDGQCKYALALAQIGVESYMERGRVVLEWIEGCQWAAGCYSEEFKKGGEFVLPTKIK